MIRRPRSRSYHAMADINIANLVDVVLVLLIIFMISAPLLQSGIEIDLPQTTAAKTTDEQEGIVLTIDKKGGIYINDVWAKLDAFDAALKKEMKAKQTEAVYLRADSSVMYASVIGVIGKLKEMGIEQIGLVTAHSEKKRGAASR